MNNSNYTCFTPHQFRSFDEFFACYKDFFSSNKARTILELIFLVLIVLINATVIIKIAFKKNNANEAIYNKIFLWLSGYYLVTTLVDIPFFLLEQEIGYWGFGETSCIIWAIYDNNMNSFVSFLELYMTYARYRSIHAPFTYLKERLFKYPNLLISSIWLFGCLIWFITVYFSGTFPYSSHVKFNPNILQFVINLFMWFLPLLGTYILGVLITIKLQKVQKVKKTLASHSHHDVSILRAIFHPKARFAIITSSFLLQWTVPCVFMLIETFLPTRIDALILAFDWSTYTVILTDPILMLIFCI